MLSKPSIFASLATLPLPADLQAWLQAYTDAHYRPEPKRRQRPASFRAPDQR